MLLTRTRQAMRAIDVLFGNETSIEPSHDAESGINGLENSSDTAKMEVLPTGP